MAGFVEDGLKGVVCEYYSVCGTSLVFGLLKV